MGPSTVAFTVRLPVELHKGLKWLGVDEGLSLQEIFERSARAYLQPDGPRPVAVAAHPPECPLASADAETVAVVREFLALRRIPAWEAALAALLVAARV